jgi:hypothetical protein
VAPTAGHTQLKSLYAEAEARGAALEAFVGQCEAALNVCLRVRDCVTGSGGCASGTQQPNREKGRAESLIQGLVLLSRKERSVQKRGANGVPNHRRQQPDGNNA